MKRPRLAVRLLSLTLITGCGANTPPPVEAKATPISAELRAEVAGLDPAQAAKHCVAKPSKSQAACVDVWCDLHPDDRTTLGMELLDLQDNPGAMALIPVAVERVKFDEGAERELLLQEVEAWAETHGQAQLANKVRQMSAMRNPGTPEESARLAASKGNWGQAAETYKDLTQKDPQRTSTCESAIEALVKAGKGAEVGPWCNSLAKEEGRSAQTLTCLRVALAEKLIPTEQAYSMALRSLSRLPGLRSEAVESLAPAGMPLLAGVADCENKKQRPVERVLGSWESQPSNSPIGLEAAVYESLASVEEDADKQFCYRAQAARSCALALGLDTGCSEPKSIGYYLLMLAERDPHKMNDVVDKLLHEKNEIYATLHNKLAYGDAALPTLFQLHLSLAFLFDQVPRLAGSGVHSVKWHVEHAETVWEKMQPKETRKAFPAVLLDKSMVKYLKKKPAPDANPF